mgnify:CR=1 FL=1
MIKIEAQTLEIAYKDAATKFNCSVTELIIEVVQTPRSGILGMFKRTAIIVAVRETQVAETVKESTPAKIKEKPTMAAEQYLKKEEPKASKPPRSKKPFKQQEKQVKVEKIEEVVVDAKIETIVAWYTPQIPISNGPEQSYGLPGLILELNTKNTTMLCSKIVLNPEKKDEIIRPTKGDVVTKKEYTDMVQFKMQEMRDNRGRSRGGKWN